MRLFAQAAAVIFALMLFSFGTAVITRYALVLPQLRELLVIDNKNCKSAIATITPSSTTMKLS